MQSLVQITDMKFKYPKAKENFLDIEELSIPQGAIVAFIGPNGSGKTTLFRCIEGFLRPDSGTILIDGKNEKGAVSQVFQAEHSFEHMSVKDWVLLNGLLKRIKLSRDDVDGLLRRIGLAEKANDAVSELSGGQQRRVSIACALLGEPKLILLDEPTVGLDKKARENIWNDVKQTVTETGATVIFSSHLLDEVENMAQTVYLFNSGKIIKEGTPAELLGELSIEMVGESYSPFDIPQSDLNCYVSVNADKYLLHIKNEELFRQTYGGTASFVKQGVQFRAPDLRDLYATYLEN